MLTQGPIPPHVYIKLADHGFDWSLGYIRVHTHVYMYICIRERLGFLRERKKEKNVMVIYYAFNEPFRPPAKIIVVRASKLKRSSEK